MTCVAKTYSIDIHYREIHHGQNQIYLTEQEQAALRTLAGNTGRSQSELIREAVDRLSEQAAANDRGRLLGAVAGLWADGAEREDFVVVRREADRIEPR